jgi:hypothetical protein
MRSGDVPNMDSDVEMWLARVAYVRKKALNDD